MSHTAGMTYVAPRFTPSPIRLRTGPPPWSSRTRCVLTPPRCSMSSPSTTGPRRRAAPSGRRRATRLPGPAVVVDRGPGAARRRLPVERPHRRHRRRRPAGRLRDAVGLRPGVCLPAEPGELPARRSRPRTASRSGPAATTSLTLEELDPSTQVRVASHAVGFDPPNRPGDPGRWYCDIQLTDHDGNELKAYMPFVRLALARYQEHSIPGCELSRVVLADFAQLSPTRSVTIGSELLRADQDRDRGRPGPEGRRHDRRLRYRDERDQSVRRAAGLTARGSGPRGSELVARSAPR